MLRTHTCGELTKKNKDEQVKLAGWVHRRRNLGGLIFIDLRDRYGLTQIIIDPQKYPEVAREADKVKNEWVIQISGTVREREAQTVNDKLQTGAIEIEASLITVLGESQTPPFQIDEDKQDVASEQLRLQYRFIDLRRPKLQEMLRVRDELIRHIRAYFHKHDFREVQTPILANSSPEGARDWLVPSRLYPGKFYALPQAPQQFKQLLMVAGVDRYFQIAPCFRDEDPRMDRHYGEFYQLDMEMSFVEQDDIFQIMEPLMIELTEKFSPKKVTGLDDNGRFRKIPWREAMLKYGSDKPDLRYDLEIVDITDIVRDSNFSVFKQAAVKGAVHALKVDGGAKFTRKDIDEMESLAKKSGLGGLAYIINDKAVRSPILKHVGENTAADIINKTRAKTGDIIFIAAGSWRMVCGSLGIVRVACAEKLGLKDNNKAVWAWITDFPMYDYSEIEEGKIDFAHNPFSMPQGGLEALETKDPLDILAYQYDLTLNGFELTSGAIRNHRPDIMYKAFAIAGYTKQEVDDKFGHMIRAFEYGAPPHGGNAPGIDRLLMVLNDWNSIRDIYAFPKDSAGRDVMLNAPSEVTDAQLKELHIKINPE